MLRTGSTINSTHPIEELYHGYTTEIKSQLIMPDRFRFYLKHGFHVIWNETEHWVRPDLFLRKQANPILVCPHYDELFVNGGGSSDRYDTGIIYRCCRLCSIFITRHEYPERPFAIIEFESYYRDILKDQGIIENARRMDLFAGGSD